MKEKYAILIGILIAITIILAFQILKEEKLTKRDYVAGSIALIIILVILYIDRSYWFGV